MTENFYPKKSLRFSFGKNWKNFSRKITESRIKEAEKSLISDLGLKSLNRKTFLDVGCGSGLFSVAARNLGAVVCSLDIDPLSVDCTQKLKDTFYPGDSNWMLITGSIIEPKDISNLSEYDIVYAWGSLHHTGSMWKALDITSSLVSDNGLLYLSLYNDQGMKSVWWKKIKKQYCTNNFWKAAISSFFIPLFIIYACVIDFIEFQNPITRYRQYYKKRGMSQLYDWVDWLGGYPFEVSSPEEIKCFFKKRKFEMIKFEKAKKAFGCNGFLLKKNMALNNFQHK